MDVVTSSKILMKQGDGGEFPINVGGLQDGEVSAFGEALEKSKAWVYYNHSLTYKDNTYPDTFALPTVPKDFATKEAKFVELQCFNDKGDSGFLKMKCHVLKSGVTTELDAMIAHLKTLTLGSFGRVQDVSYTVSK